MIVSNFVSKTHSLLPTASIPSLKCSLHEKQVEMFYLSFAASSVYHFHTSFVAIFLNSGDLEHSRPRLSPHHTSLKSRVGISLPIHFCTLVKIMEKFAFESAVCGYHVYRDLWEPLIGEKLVAKQDFDYPMNKFAVKVTKSNETVGH